ncbi:DUF6292 family protein [Amycolatopsis sp. WGS_07]|uniref:DUF6292 family protein n=1 Tax=Amycolatopsis sp. WGS_07 TaxID=3076764 RepID=UPI003873015D
MTPDQDRTRPAANIPLSPAPRGALPHEPYVRAVVERLDRCGLTVSGLQLLDSPAPQATLRIAAPRHAGTGTAIGDADLITMRWNGDTGWAMRVKYGADALPRATVHFGPDPVPDPADVADWAYYGLREPLLLRTRDPDAPRTAAHPRAALSRHRQDDS